MLETILSNTNIPSETIGEKIILDILSKNDYGKKHYHFCCEHDGTKDILNNRITVNDYLGKQNILYKNPKNLTFISFPYHISLLNKEYYWFNNLSQEQFFSSDMYISKLFRKLFKI